MNDSEFTWRLASFLTRALLATMFVVRRDSKIDWKKPGLSKSWDDVVREGKTLEKHALLKLKQKGP